MLRALIGYAETKLVLAAALLALLCGAGAHTFFSHFDRLRTEGAALVAGNERARHLVTVLSLLQDAETGQRGYLLTGRPVHLKPYDQARARIDAGLAVLRPDYAHDPLASALVASVTRKAADRLAALEHTLRVYRNEGLAAAQQVILQDVGRRTMDAVRTDIAALLDAEQANLDRVMRGERAASERSAGVKLWAGVAVLLPLGLCLVLALRDTRRGRREAGRLAHVCDHDALTGLLNRPALLARVERALAGGQGGVGLVYLDLDGFKPINDELGHAAGDAVLVEVAVRLAGAARPGDAVARMGGDEFVVLAEGCPDRAALEALARRLEATVGGVRLPLLGARRVGASAGVALGPADGRGAAELLAAADAAMYARKARERTGEPALARPRLVAANG